MIEVKVATKRIEKLLALAPKELKIAFSAATNRGGRKFLAEHRRRHLSAKRQAATGPLVGTQKGFVGSRVMRVRGGGVLDGELRLEISLAGGVAVAHEEGRRLTPRRGPYLPVPFPAAVDARGRLTARARRLLKESADAWRRVRSGNTKTLFAASTDRIVRRRKGEPGRGLTLVKTKEGKLLLVETRRRRGALNEVRALFHLERSVQLKPRLGFYGTFDSFRDSFREEFVRSIPYAMAAARRAAK